MREIQLTRDQIALVDDEDYERIAAFRWHARSSVRARGPVAWYADRAATVEGRETKRGMHQDVLGTPSFSGQHIDHINGNGLDNRRANLRICTNAQNQYNKRPIGASGFKGVTWHKKMGRWQAAIKQHGHNRYLGLFDAATEAARAYDQAARELYGQFAYLNFPRA